MNTTATTVMIESVYGVEAAFVVVRLQAGSSDDGMTSGNRATNRLATASAIVAPEPMNAQPSRRSRLATSAPDEARARRATATTTSRR